MVAVDDLVVQAIGTAVGAAARREHAKPTVLLVRNALCVEQLVVRHGQFAQVRKLTHWVVHPQGIGDRRLTGFAWACTAAPGEEIGHVVASAASLQVGHQTHESVFAFTDTDVIPDSVGHGLLGHHGRVHSAYDQRRQIPARARLLAAQPTRQTHSLRILLGQAGKRDHTRPPSLDLVPGIGVAGNRGQVFVQVDELRLVPGALQAGRERRQPVVEPHLRVQVGVNEEHAHAGCRRRVAGRILDLAG